MAYFSNGTEGEILYEQCAVCPIGKHPELPCPVLFVQTQYNYRQFDKKGMRNIASEVLNDLIEDKTGKCLMKQAVEKAIGIQPSDEPLHVIPGMEEWAKNHGVKIA